jgi:hypothetical protein
VEAARLWATSSQVAAIEKGSPARAPSWQSPPFIPLSSKNA